MKKLMITLSAAALATSVFANEDTPTMYQETEGFETYAAETVIKTDTPTVAEGTTMLWYSAGADGETGTVKAYGENDGKLDGAGNQYLNVETTTGTPLYRKLVAHNAGDGVNQDSDLVDIGDGIYVDTYVQFTASEEAPAEIADSKLVVWVKETADEEAGTSTTNLMVMAGQLDGSGNPATTKNFVIETGTTDLSGWHQLTIRAMKESSIAAFTLFLDGVQLAAKEIQVPGKDAVLGEGGVEVEPAVDPVTYEDFMGTVANLSAEAQKFYDEKQLFFSMVDKDAAIGDDAIAQKISAVGFDGSGQIDNVTTTTTAPGFARGYFTISWDDGVKSFKVMDGENEVFSKSGITAADKEVFPIPENATELIVTVTEYNVGFSGGNGTVILDESRSYVIDTKTTLVEVDGKGYYDFAEALADSNDKKMTLSTSFELSGIKVSGNVTIDLAGNTITYVPAVDNEDTDEDESDIGSLFVVTEGATLKIIDSIGGGKVQYNGGPDLSGSGLITTEGCFILGDVDDNKDQGATIDGLVIDNEYSQYVRGKVLYLEQLNAEYNDETGDYYVYFNDYLYQDDNGNKSVVAYEDGYFVIAPSAGGEEPEPEEPTPTTFEVTVTEATNATYTVTGAYDLNAVESGTELTFTATANEGYEYTTVDGWNVAAGGATATYTVTVTEAITVAIPEPTEKVVTFSVAVTANEKVEYTSNPETLTGLTAGTEVTITATAKTGYTYDGADAAEGWSFDGQTATYTATIADADIAVTIPVPVLVKAAFGDTEYATEEDAQTAKNSFEAPAGVDGSIFSVEVVGTKVTVTLNEEVVKTSADTVAKAVGEALAKVLDGTAATDGITLTNVKNGLEYAVASAIELKDLNSVEPADGAYVKAQDGTVTLKVNKPSDSKGFFKIKVKYSGK